MTDFVKKLGELKKERSFENLFQILCSYGDAVAAEYRDWGAQFLAVGLDVTMFAQAARAKAATWKG